MDITCVQPWTSFFIGENHKTGSHICCRDILPKPIPFMSNFLKWRNHPYHVNFREMMISNKISDTICRKECPELMSKMKNGKYFLETIDEERLFKNDPNVKLLKYEIDNKETILHSYPIYCHLTTDHDCNFNCIMCPTKKDTAYYITEEAIDFTQNILKESPGNLLVLLVGGEPFYSRYNLDIIEDLSKHKNAWFQIITNGSLFHTNLLNRMQLSDISVSLDSPFEKTFEKIRINSNFKTVEKNLKKYLELKKDKNFHLNILMTVSTLNYTQILDMFKYITSISNEIVMETYPIIEKYNDPLNIFQKCALDERIDQSFNNSFSLAIEEISASNYPYRFRLIKQLETLIFRKNDIKEHYRC